MSIRAKYLTSDKRLTFEIEAPTQKEVFAEIAAIEEVFDAEHQCGICQGTQLRHVVRHATGKGNQTFHFYELHCQNPECRARFQFGQSTQNGDLFPKRRDSEGNAIGTNGWTRYTGGGNQEHEDPLPPQQQRPQTSGQQFGTTPPRRR